MFQIVLHGPGYLDTRYELPVGETRLGRGDGNHVVLSGEDISRHHLRIVRERDRLRLEDLLSRNGTLLNGSRVVGSTPLRSGDRIEVGDYRLSVESMIVSSDATTVVLQRQIDGMPAVETLRRAQAIPGEAALDAGSELGLLALLSLVSERLASAPSLDAFLNDVASLVLELAHAQTVVVLLQETTPPATAEDQVPPLGGFEDAPQGIGTALLYDTQDASPRAKAAAEGTRAAEHRPAPLVPVAIRHLTEGLDGKIPVSWSIVDRCLEERAALCIEDASVDPRFANQESVVINGVRQAICVPLLSGRSPAGAIYVTREGQAQDLEKLLEALTAIAHLAASGIERQRLKERAAHEAELRGGLARFLAPDVAEQIAQAGGAGLGMEERTATVVFADICGFTALAERAPAASVVALLDEFYRRMSAVIFEYRGTLDKFIGDAVMAIFGAPYSREDDAARALQAAVAMQASFDEWMASKPEDERVSLKVGVNTGRLFAGTVGGERLEYTAVGDTVNVASRLAADAEAASTLCTQATIDAAGGRFVSSCLGERVLRGRSEAVVVHQVLGEKGSITAES